MHRWIVTVAWLLVFALPLQAWAACAGCPGHAGRCHTSVAAEAETLPCHDVAAAEGTTAAAEAVVHAVFSDAGAAHHGTMHVNHDTSSCDGCDGCPTCAASHGSATGPSTAATLPGQARSPAPVPAASTDAPAFLTPGPDRPPRSFLA